MRNRLNYIARVVVGSLFIFSGAIKLNDPIGMSIKLHEYFEVFSADISSFFGIFTPLSLVLAVILSAMEVVLGVALLVNWKMKITSWALLGLMLFFTFLTFYSAYFNKVTDCGCFGDAITLTPWQSFTKDLILMVLIIPIFILRKESETRMKKAHANLVVSVSTLISLIIAITAIRYLPFIDFRAYSVGTHIPTAMKPSEPLRHVYVMEKNGIEERFSSNPADTTYHFVRMEIENPEAQPEIMDFSIWTDEGNFTDQVSEGKKLLILIYDVKKAKRIFGKINQLVTDCEANGITPWAITASSYAEFEDFRHEVQLAIPYFYADATILKTMIRANPGLMLLDNGTIKGKWHVNATPDVEKVKELVN